MNILIVDDDATVSKLLGIVVEQSGLNPVLARSISSALAILEKETIHLIVLDWALSDGSGTQLARQLRSQKRYQSTPILMISGKTTDADVALALQAGVTSFLPKPFTPAQLRTGIRSAFAAQKAVNIQYQVRDVVGGQRSFESQDPRPLVLFGEPVNTVQDLQRSHRKVLAKYLVEAVQALKEINAAQEGLALGYRIEKTSYDILRLVKRATRMSSRRIKLVIVSSECSGNTVMLVRMLTLNTEIVKVVFIVEHRDSVSRVQRAGLEALGVKLFKRAEIDRKKIRQFAEESVAPTAEDSQISAQQIRARLLDDIETMATLPALPQVYHRIMRLAQDEDSDLPVWGKTIGTDPLTSASVIRCARSPAYGFKGPIGDVNRAVILLGKKVVKDLVTAESMRQAFSAIEESGFSMDAYWLHSVSVGFAASLLAFPVAEEQWTPEQRQEFDSFALPPALFARIKEIDLPSRLALSADEDPFVGGIMHDIGKAAMVCAYPDLYPLIVRELEEKQWAIPMWEAEEQLTGSLTHATVGELLARKWQLGDALCRAVHNHHTAEADNAYSMLIGLADLIGLAAHPFPAEARYPVEAALQEGNMDKIRRFLPMGFTDQTFLPADDFAPLARDLLPVVRRLTANLQQSIAV